MPSWESVTALSGLMVAVITGSVAYGRLRQRVSDMGKQVTMDSSRLTVIEGKTNDGEGDRREIMAKLDNLAEGQKEMRDLLLNHITERKNG